MINDISKICVGPTQSIHDTMATMNANRFGIVFVADDKKHLLGTVTDGDIRRAVLARIGLDMPIVTILENKSGTKFAKPITAPAGRAKSYYLTILRKYKVLHLPLLNAENELVGMVGLNDLLPDQDNAVQAVLMAGGQGKRLMPLTENTPKPMLPVGDKPLMEIIIRKLRESGIKNVKITTHHEKEKILNYFKDGKALDVNVSYIDEDKPLGTAGALGLIKKKDINGTLLVMNGDILTNMDFRSMVAYHREHNADITVAVRQYDFKVPYGVVECEDHTVKGIIEKPVYNFFVNAGIYLLEPKVLAHVSKEGERLDMNELLHRAIDGKCTVVSFPIFEQWIDIGQHADYKEAQQLAKKVAI